MDKYQITLTDDQLNTFKEALAYMERHAPSKGENLEARIESAEQALGAAERVN